MPAGIGTYGKKLGAPKKNKVTKKKTKVTKKKQ